MSPKGWTPNCVSRVGSCDRDDPVLPDERLEINTLDGMDSVDSTGLDRGTIQLFVDGVPVP